MNILLIAHRIPYPPDKGEKIRSFHHLDYLARRHNVWCACLIDDPNDWQYLPALRKLCREVAAFPRRRIAGLARSALNVIVGGTATEGYFASRQLALTVRQWSEQIRFDALLASSSGTARYGLGLPIPRRVLDLCDVDSAKWIDYAERSHGPRRWLYRLEASRLARREWELARAYDATMLVTRREAELFEGICGDFEASSRNREHPKVLVVRNGVDLASFKPSERPVESPVIGFVGTMDYPPNVDAVRWFADEMWPRVLQARPDARFLVVGRTPSREVKSLGLRPGIEVTGWVPDVRESLARMRVCVAPMRIAHGVQNKVLEAMASGKPVVMTSPVAEAIGVEPDKGGLVADDADTFAGFVSSLLMDGERCRELGLAGRALVESEWQWEGQLALVEAELAGRNDRV